MTKTKGFFTLTRMVSVSVMTAFAVFGRIAFAAIPNFKPTTAIVILSGLAFLTEGVPGFALPVIVAVPYLIWEKRWKEIFILPWFPLLGALTAVLPWAFLIHQAEADFLRYIARRAVHRGMDSTHSRWDTSTAPAASNWASGFLL